MIEIIRNEHLVIGISKNGAELKSVKTTNDNLEYLWQGNINSWKRSSPVLFPVVGSLNNNRYVFNGKSYSLSPHGFARDSQFDIIKRENDEILFSLEDTEESLKIYPFSFQLVIGYRISGNCLTVSYKVLNKNNYRMFFSIGAHPGFNCPLEEGLAFDDYKLIMEKKEISCRRYKTDNLISGVRKEFFTGNREVKLNHDLFKAGALIFDDLKSERICLETDRGNRKITMDFKNFPYFGIWSWPKNPADFICLEPWYGIDSSKGDPPNFEKKEGLIELGEEQEFESFYSLEFE